MSSKKCIFAIFFSKNTTSKIALDKSKVHDKPLGMDLAARPEKVRSHAPPTNGLPNQGARFVSNAPLEPFLLIYGFGGAFETPKSNEPHLSYCAAGEFPPEA